MRILRGVLGLLTLIAIGTQLIIQIRLGASLINFFSYFTNLSNLIAALTLLVTAWSRFPSRKVQSMRALSTINMAIVGIVFTLLLRDEDLGALRPWINFVLHYLMPCAVVLDWLIEPPAMPMGLRKLPAFLIFPAAYLVYVLLRGVATGWYPYPFLNPQRVGSYAGVAVYAGCIAMLFLLVGWAVLLVGSRRAARAINLLSAIVLTVMLVPCAWGAPSKSPRADLVFQSGAIYTMDGARSWAQAVATASGRILSVGTNEQVAAGGASSLRQRQLAGVNRHQRSPTRRTITGPLRLQGDQAPRRHKAQ